MDPSTASELFCAILLLLPIVVVGKGVEVTNIPAVVYSSRNRLTPRLVPKGAAPSPALKTTKFPGVKFCADTATDQPITRERSTVFFIQDK